ncbi:MAG TPA: peptide-methionine (S)-S-oxide reductase MsrA [Thermodesulfobacteriota bacterium]|nr:peptide-methionine (S)-S-oxide reductase MsrA [Thermodesulfobacteriota bacterium]
MEENGGKYKKATFSGGCFWCMQPPFDNLPGVVSTTVGYTGGTEKNPSYHDVCYGRTNHLESIEVVYDPDKVSYEELLDVFWLNIDPTDDGGQFVDRGRHYKTAIFYHDEEQKKTAEESKRKLEESGRYKAPVVTTVRPAMEFYPAEDYHQKYYEKNPIGYSTYKAGSGREGYIQHMKGMK